MARDPMDGLSLPERILEVERSIYTHQDRFRLQRTRLAQTVKQQAGRWGLVAAAVGAGVGVLACFALPRRHRPQTWFRRWQARREEGRRQTAARQSHAESPSVVSTVASYMINLAVSAVMPMIMSRLGLVRDPTGPRQPKCRA